MVGCSIHFFVSKSRSVVRGAVECCVCMRMLCCVVCCVVWCGVVCIFVSFCVVFSFLSQCSSFSFLLSLSFFLLSSFLSSLFSLLFLFFSLLFSPPNTMERTDQPTRRPTSRHLNVIWHRASAQQSVLSLLLSPPSSPHKEETVFYRNVSGEAVILHYNFYVNSEKSPPGEITVITVLN